MSDSTVSIHPISLNWVSPRELRFVATKRGKSDLNINEDDFRMGDRHSDLDPSSNTIHVFLRGEIGVEEDFANLPFYLLVELVGQFKVNTTLFPVEKLDLWADKVAPYILYPFLREHIYGLSSRAGYPAVTIPLLEVPSLKQSDLDYLAEIKQRHRQESE